MSDATPDMEDAPAEAARRPARIALPAWTLAAALLAALAAVFVPPVAQDGLVALLDDEARGIDTMVTGTVRSPHRRYTVHRSVLHPDGAACTVFANGTAHGAC